MCPQYVMKEFPKKYDTGFEQELYTWREKQWYFKPSESKTGEQFTIILPPPNVTWKLHLGHSVMTAIEDAMVRYHRMQWDETLWLPGTDHASISTQVVVEQQLAARWIDKKSLTREEFLAHVRERVRESRSTITQQIKSMGASLDRSRERFTMWENESRWVRSAFKQLFDQEKIYRSTYMVNRSPGAETVLSDLEVNHEEIDTKMYTIRYFVQWKGDSISVSTIRPETIFADVAIAVHPKDRRYKKWIGRNVLIPIVNRPIPIIADEQVQIEFGTWALKITPTHSEEDFIIAQRHDLPLDRFAIDKANVFTELAWPGLEGKPAYEFLDNLIYHLKEIGNLEKVEDYRTKIPVCERTGVRVQPTLSKQWFMNVDPAAKRLLEAFDKEEVDVHPVRFVKTFRDRLEKIRPRCISRQLYRWHRIPIWYDADAKGYAFTDDTVIDLESGISSVLSMIVFNLIADTRLSNPFSLEDLVDILTTGSLTPQHGRVVDVYMAQYALDKRLSKECAALAKIFDITEWSKISAIEKQWGQLVDLLDESCNIAQSGDNYVFEFRIDGKVVELTQEDDVLDTWFSSGLRPFVTMWWPDKTADLDKFYPNNVLETGYDIILQRVIKMMILGVEMTGQLPFKDVYFHGLVRDAKGAKMSKSKGNGIDPLRLIEKYGADSLRGALLLWNTPGNDQKFSEQKINYVSRFITKFWNASRFVMKHSSAVGDMSRTELETHLQKNAAELNDYDTWILGKLSDLIATVTKYHGKFMLGEALQETITFVWNDFCDWYIEIAKRAPSDHTGHVLRYVVMTSCSLLHPFLPFATEKLWSLFGGEWALIVSQRPQAIGIWEKNYRMNLLMDMIAQWRALRTQVTEKPHDKVTLSLQSNIDIHTLVQDHAALVTSILNVETIHYTSEVDQVDPDFTTAVLMDITLGAKWMKTVDWKSVLKDFELQKSEEEQFLTRMRSTLAAPWFMDNAPAHIVEDKKKKLAEVKAKIAKIDLEIQKIRMKHK